MNGSSFVLDFQVTSKLFTNIFKCTADIFKRGKRYQEMFSDIFK